MINCVIKKEDSLTDEEKKKLEELLIPLFSWSYHFSHSFNTYHTLYFSSKPKWRLFLYKDKELIGSLSIVLREIDNPVKLNIGGIGNIAVKKIFQDKGLGTYMLKKTHEFLSNKNINISLLFCIERLKKLYIKVGYILINHSVKYCLEGKLQKEPLSLFFPINLSPEMKKRIQSKGLNIGEGSW